MDATRQKSNLGLLVIIVVGVVILYAALLTAVAFRDTGSPADPAPPSPAVRGEAAPTAPPSGMAAPGQSRRLPAEPLRVSPVGPVGKASEDSLSRAGNLPGGGKALGN